MFRVAVSLPKMPILTEDRPGKNAFTVDLTLLFFPLFYSRLSFPPPPTPSLFL